MCAKYMGFVPIPGSKSLERICHNLFTPIIMNEELVKQALMITQGFKGDPNPQILNYFK
jgi:hypothetical protein